MENLSYTIRCALLRLVCVLLGVILFAMVGISPFVYGMASRIDCAPESALPVFSRDPELTSDSSRIGGKGSGIINILLVGQDSREGLESARSDSMILCTFHPEHKSITTTSFLRDLYVPIPGHGSNRLNAAYALGGTSLLKQTLEEAFDLHIDGCVEVDFSEFSQVIDLLGGVYLELRSDEAQAINAVVPGDLVEGHQWLTGSQALAYARIRNLDADADFSRTNRQRKVISSLVRSYKDANMGSLLTMLKQALPLIHTDLSQTQLLRYAVELWPLLSGTEITSQRIPADGAYEDVMVQGMAVLQADLEAASALLRQTLLPNQAPAS